MIPKHSNPEQPDRIAHAPYNFVPLPEQVVWVDYKIPEHDVYAGNTGYLDCTLTTLTPTYTRAALKPEFFAEWADNLREMMENDAAREQYARFFHLEDAERPMIPGSSLRGMVRTLVEIAGYGKMQWTTDKRLFFRTVDNTAVGRHYRSRMTNKVEGGFLRKHRGKYYVKKCRVVRVHRSRLGGKRQLYQGRTPNLTPRWGGAPAQYIPVWVEVPGNGNFVQQVAYQPTPGLIEGRLVITGDVPRKKKEFVFLLPAQDAEEIPVPDEVVDRFHDDDQITRWQQRAFPKNKPQDSCRQRDGMLRKDNFLSQEGDPVFFLRENGQLTFFGRAQMFRLPYLSSPVDLVPSELCQREGETIDLAEAIFGYIAGQKGDHVASRAGRVYFTDAVCKRGQQGVWSSQESVTPKILGSPKPTTFQHYLVQDKKRGHDPARKNTLAHYDTPRNETTIRGYKLYWHKEDVPSAQDFAEQDRPDWTTDTQHTQIKPVKAGVEFTFRIYFENLTDVELGALLWVLDLPEGHHHKIGMGKPLGLGSVAIESRLVLTDRSSRYQKLFDDSDWHTAEANEHDSQRLKQEFERYILKHMDENERDNAQTLAEVPRIEMLLKMLEWPGPDANTGYMDLGKFRQRPVLPDPLNVGQRHSLPSRGPRQPQVVQPAPSPGHIQRERRRPLAQLEVQTQQGTSNLPKEESVRTNEVSHPGSVQDLAPRMRVEGVITRVTSNRLAVDIGVGVEATLPPQELGLESEDLQSIELRGKYVRATVKSVNKKGRAQLINAEWIGKGK